jgi:hypothetical protein
MTPCDLGSYMCVTPCDYEIIYHNCDWEIICINTLNLIDITAFLAKCFEFISHTFHILILVFQQIVL